MILIIDNYDSFVFNLARYIEKLGRKTRIVRNDKITLDEIASLKPHAIIISPGPCAPQDSGIIIDAIKTFGETTPILGVCLGHQAIGEAYGGQTVRALKPVHGKSSMIEHDDSPLFHHIENPMQAGRYHSLVTALPENSDLIVTAQSPEGEIMAMRHKIHPVYGIQFHPESILTPQGSELLRNFLIIAQDWHSEHTVVNTKENR